MSTILSVFDPLTYPIQTPSEQDEEQLDQLHRRQQPRTKFKKVKVALEDVIAVLADEASLCLGDDRMLLIACLAHLEQSVELLYGGDAADKLFAQ